MRTTESSKYASFPPFQLTYIFAHDDDDDDDDDDGCVMKAILKGDKEVKAWLDYESVPLDEVQVVS